MLESVRSKVALLLRVTTALALTALGAWIGSALLPDWVLDTWGRPCPPCLTYLGCLGRCLQVGSVQIGEGPVQAAAVVVGIIGGLAVGALADTVLPSTTPTATGGRDTGA